MLKILELFAGYGSQALALENLGLEFTSDISEVDKYAIEAYNQINGQTKNYGVPQNRERVFVVSIRKDLNQTYMFPEPMPLTLKLKDLLETEVDERYYLPQEKVEKLILNLNKDISNTVRCGGGGSLDGKHTWDLVVDYTQKNEYKGSTNNVSPCLTEAMGMGGGQIPIVVNCGTANDCTKFERYPPTTGVLEIGVKREVLYKITKEGNIRGFQNDEKKSGAAESQFYNPNNVCGALTTQGVAGLIEIGNIFDTEYFGGNPQAGRVYSAEGLSPCLNTMEGGERQPKVLEISIGNNPIGKKFEFDGFNDQPEPTLLATDYKAPKCYSDGIRIRKLTPRECWRLMGVKDEQYDRLNGISNTQLYKMAGNSIVVNVLMAIFKNLLISDKETKGQLSLL